MGGRLRLRYLPLPPDPLRGLSLSEQTRSDPAAPTSSRSLKCIRRPCSSPTAPRAWRLREARGFGTVCAWDGAKPIASSLPFYLVYADDGTPQAAFHVARGNPLARLADGKSSLADGGDRRRMPMCRPTGTSRPIRCRPGFTRPCISAGRCGCCPIPNSARIWTRSAPSSKAGLSRNRPGRCRR